MKNYRNRFFTSNPVGLRILSDSETGQWLLEIRHEDGDVELRECPLNTNVYHFIADQANCEEEEYTALALLPFRDRSDEPF